LSDNLLRYTDTLRVLAGAPNSYRQKAMILFKDYNRIEKAYYFAAKAAASLVYLEGGFILRIGVNSKTVNQPFIHDFCECGGVPGEISEIAVNLIGGYAASVVSKSKFTFTEHEDYDKAQILAVNLDNILTRMPFYMRSDTLRIMDHAKARAIQMCDEIWIAIQKLADAILQFDRLDREEATYIVKNALKDKEIANCALSWLFIGESTI
jgi:hypothetical protein